MSHVLAALQRAQHMAAPAPATPQALLPATAAVAGTQLPQDAAEVQQLLAEMSVEEYDPRVVNQLLDFKYRYLADILMDAEAYAQAGDATDGVLTRSWSKCQMCMCCATHMRDSMFVH